MKNKILILIAISCNLLSAEEPPQLSALRTQYEAALAAATKPVNDRYIQKLEALKNSAMTQKNLELAIAVDAELGKFTEKPLAPLNDLTRRLGGTTWTWPDKNFPKEKAWFRLNEDGTASSGWHTKQGWWKVLSNDTVEIKVTGSPGTNIIRLNKEIDRATDTKSPTATYNRVNRVGQ